MTSASNKAKIMKDPAAAIKSGLMKKNVGMVPYGAGKVVLGVAKAIIKRTEGGIAGSAGRSVNPMYKTGTLAEPSKASVKVKTAANQKPGKKDISTFIAKRAVRNAQINEAQKGDDFVNSGIRQPGPFSDGKTKLLRQVKASNKKK